MIEINIHCNERMIENMKIFVFEILNFKVKRFYVQIIYNIVFIDCVEKTIENV